MMNVLSDRFGACISWLNYPKARPMDLRDFELARGPKAIEALGGFLVFLNIEFLNVESS